jgi:hypothetical protein
MKSNTETLAARKAGALAALEGRRMWENPHPEESDAHFEWLSAWTDARLAAIKLRHQDPPPQLIDRTPR